MAGLHADSFSSLQAHTGDSKGSNKLAAVGGPSALKAPAAVHAAGAPSHRFRLVGNVVRAVKRFQNAINPTYTYGRMPEEPSVLPPHLAAVAQTRTLSGPPGTGRSGMSGRAASGRTASGRPTVPGIHHGHKAGILFKPLPEPVSSEA